MFFGRVGRLGNKLLGNLGASRRHAGLVHVRLDELEHFSLARGKGFHSMGTCLFIQHTGSIYSAGARQGQLAFVATRRTFVPPPL